ncbi:MAG: VCBS repeat-containing protein [Candidatus Aminicenantes bacterium]|jgi:hypothetical protein
MRKIWLALIVLFGFYIFMPFGAFAQDDGWFLPYEAYAIGAHDGASGDFNDDGRNDVAVIAGDFKLYIYLQGASGDLQPPVSYDSFEFYFSYQDLEVGDFNGDNLLDLVADAGSDGIAIFYQNANGTIDPYTYIDTTYITRAVRPADINDDGRTDIVVVSSSGGTIYVEILEQDVDGTLLAPNVVYSTTDSINFRDTFNIGDVSDDNLLDIVIAMGDGSGNDIRVLIQNADGTFSPVSYPVGDLPEDVAIGDVNGDGLNDVVASYGGNTPNSFVSVVTQNNLGTLDPPVSYPVYDIPGHLRIMDADRDGLGDVIVLHNGWSRFGLLLQNNSTNTLDNEVLYEIPSASWYKGLNVGDINSDGYEDLLISGPGFIIAYGWDNVTPGLVVKYPSYGSTYDMNSPLTIRWGDYGDIDEVDISYSFDGGVNWLIIANNEGNDGSYSWTTPYIPSDDYIIRVTNSTGGLDAYSGRFSVVDDGVDRVFVESPNGGESLVADTTYNITWMSTGTVDNVKLEYSTDDGTTWTEIIDSTPEADGSYTWTVPNEPSNQCLVRISDVADSNTNDTSDAVFTIYEPGTETITVTAPNGGESITGGSTFTITWTYTGSIATVALAYTTDNGANWNTIGTVLNTGSYSWNVPNVYSTQCRVRVRDATNTVVSDQSNNVFSIGTFGAETATVLSPNGGEVFCIGRTAAITWATTGLVGNMRIQYSTNNGASWKNIVASTANDGYYLWNVPDDASTQCLVRVQEASDGDPTDTSDALFSIAECGATISITSPKGGEAWQVGAQHNITWVSGEKVGNSVKLQYSTNNQATWNTITSSTANDGSYAWTIPNAPSTTCNVKIMDTSDTSISNVSFGTFAIVSGSVKPEISLNRTHLYYGAMKSSTAKTPTQTITVNNTGYGTLKWLAAIYDEDPDDSDDLAWIQLSNTAGTESGTVKVDIEPLGMAVGTYTGAVKFTSTDASNSPQMVYVTLKVYASQADANPFGSFDTPVHGSTVMSSIPVTGWALDDIGIDEVTVWRNTMPGEGSGEVYIGKAVMVEGPRPDVEQAYPTYPMSYKGGWGYMLLTNMLPNGGNGSFTLHAYAKDLAGRQVKLGSKTITCDNAHAVKPFGAIDTPDQGGEATGTDFRNQGWVLTPMPNKIPTDGSTIGVYIDGQKIGIPHYNIYRLDIATLFPGYANSNGAMGYLDFDTTAYESGVHTIQWVATDNAGNRDGIGSRYFSIQNSGYNSHSTSKTSTASKSTVGKTHHRFSHLPGIPLEKAAPIKMTSGYKKDAKPRTISADKNGIIHITVPQDERIVLDLSQPHLSSYTGYLKVNHLLRPLPPGASMDAKVGILYWQPGPASFGKYQLVFISTDKIGKPGRKEVAIEVVPKFPGQNRFKK